MIGESLQLVDIGMENAINKTNTRRLIRVRVWELDVDLPNSTLERSYQQSAYESTGTYSRQYRLSVGPLKRTKNSCLYGRLERFEMESVAKEGLTLGVVSMAAFVERH